MARTNTNGGGSGSGVESINALTGAVTLSAGSGITLTPTGNDIEIASDGINAVIHDSSLFGDGTVSDPLGVVGGSVDFVLEVKVATTAVLPGSPVYNNGVGGVGATLTRSTNGTTGAIDGVAVGNLVAGDRILVKNQASQLQNGIYEVTQQGTVSLPYILTRTTDADETTEMDDMAVVASLGTTNRGITYGQQTNNPTIGTNNIVFTASSIFVRQQTSGTQVANQVPVYTGTAVTITKGTPGFTFNPTTNLLTSTGGIAVGGNATAQGYIDLFEDLDNGTNKVRIQPPASVAADYTITLPADDGTANQYLKTDGSGVTSWQTPAVTIENTTSLFGTGVGSGTSSTSTESVYLGVDAGDSVVGNRNVMIGNLAGQTATNTDDAVFIGNNAGYVSSGADKSVFIGMTAGADASAATTSVFIGYSAGQTATSAFNSQFIGPSAGFGATGASNGLFLGRQTGYNATGADNAIFLGQTAGYGATNASHSIMIGRASGTNASASDHTIFLGFQAGWNAPNAARSIFIGDQAGLSDTVDNTVSGYSILIGAATGTGGFKNSVAIGTQAINTAANQFLIDSPYAPFETVQINDAIIRGDSFHNNALAQGSATQQDIRSGTYTPTLTSVANIDSTTARQCQWMRVGNVVTVSGQMDVDSTTNNAQSTVGISLPIASNFTTAYECGGAGSTIDGSAAQHACAIYADATNNRAELTFYETHTTSETLTFTFTYEVL